MSKRKKDNPTTRVIMVRVNPDTYRQLRVLAGMLGKDNSELVTQAIALLAEQAGGVS